MASIKSFVNNLKQKNAEMKKKQREKKAQAKGFSSARAYETYASLARKEGEEVAKETLRKRELQRIREEAKQDVMLGRMGKYHKAQKKVQKGFETFQKGVGVYNEVMGELKSLSSGSDSFYPGQKKLGRKKARQPRKDDFWSQYY